MKGSEAKLRTVPVFKELTVLKILEFARVFCNINDYLPDIKSKYSNRSWICTIGMFVFYTIIQVNILAEEKFGQFITAKLLKRISKLLCKRSLMSKPLQSLLRSSDKQLSNLLSSPNRVL